MIDLDELELSLWQKEDIEILIEEDFPNLLELSNEELDILARKLFFQALSAYETVQRFESQGDAIMRLIEAKKEAGLS